MPPRVDDATSRPSADGLRPDAGAGVSAGWCLRAVRPGPTIARRSPDLPPQFAAQHRGAVQRRRRRRRRASILPRGGRRSTTRSSIRWSSAPSKSNPDLEIALTRLQQARTYESVVLGSRACPRSMRARRAGRGTGIDLARGRADRRRSCRRTTPRVCSSINTLAGFDAVWELDMFGKFRREFEAARYDTAGGGGCAQRRPHRGGRGRGARLCGSARLANSSRHPARGERRAARIAAHRDHPLSARASPTNSMWRSRPANSIPCRRRSRRSRPR